MYHKLTKFTILEQFKHQKLQKNSQVKYFLFELRTTLRFRAYKEFLKNGQLKIWNEI